MGVPWVQHGEDSQHEETGADDLGENGATRKSVEFLKKCVTVHIL